MHLFREMYSWKSFLLNTEIHSQYFNLCEHLLTDYDQELTIRYKLKYSVYVFYV